VPSLILSFRLYIISASKDTSTVSSSYSITRKNINKMKYTTRVALLALSVSETVLAHTGLTNFYVNGKNQGDAICVRMNRGPGDHWNFPLEDLNSADMACGTSGTQGVNRVCPVPDGATITFEFRMLADKPGQNPVIDVSHKGPCAVYAKKVDSAISDPATGDGWFKIWHEGYDSSSKKWCTEKLNAANGLMTINLPKGLLGGNYLIRPELLALHNAGKPQYFVSCAQVFVQSSGNLGPASTVAIPGYVDKSDPSDSYDIYKQTNPYPIPGPGLAKLQTSSARRQDKLTEGLKSAGCILESGSNFCGTEVQDYNSEDDCWKVS